MDIEITEHAQYNIQWKETKNMSKVKNIIKNDRAGLRKN